MNRPIDVELLKVVSSLSIMHEVITKSVLSAHGLRRPRFFALQALHLTPGLTLGQLCEEILLDRASASRMIFSMEKEELVRREPDESDRRQFTLYLTEAGDALFQAANADFEADITARFSALDSETKESLLKLNRRLEQVLVEHYDRHHSA